MRGFPLISARNLARKTASGSCLAAILNEWYDRAAVRPFHQSWNERRTYALVSIRRIFFQRSFSRQFCSTSHQRFIGTPFSNSIRIATGQRGVVTNSNVFWGALNLVVGYLLVYHVGEFHLRTIQDALTLGIGGLLMAIMLSRAFAPIYGGAKGQCIVRLPVLPERIVGALFVHWPAILTRVSPTSITRIF